MIRTFEVSVKVATDDDSDDGAQETELATSGLQTLNDLADVTAFLMNVVGRESSAGFEKSMEMLVYRATAIRYSTPLHQCDGPECSISDDGYDEDSYHCWVF